MSREILKEKLSTIDKQLEYRLNEIQVTFSHNGNRGTTAESIMREFVRGYVPSNCSVGEGEIIDSLGNNSTQMDLIISNENQPYINSPNQPGLYIIEGVDCVGEIKTNLNSQDILTIINSCQKFKKLIANFTGGMALFNESDEIRFIKRKPYFLFAYKSQLTIETIWEKLVTYYKENETPIYEQVDAIFLLDRGTIINFGDGNGSFKFYKKDTKVTMPGIHIVKSEPNEILVDMMTWLSVTIHRVVYYNNPLARYLI